MTERQYNRKLLGDKLSQLPVPPNDLLWSRIEAQLIIATPVSQPVSYPSNVAPRFTKAVLIKTSIAIFSTLLLVLFILWIARKHQRSQKAIPPATKQQTSIADTTKPTAGIVDTLPTQQEKIPQLLPEKNEQKTVADTVDNFAPVRPLRSNDISVSMRDSVLPMPLTTQATADSVKLKVTLPKKDDGYYFEVKKKKGN